MRESARRCGPLQRAGPGESRQGLAACCRSRAGQVRGQGRRRWPGSLPRMAPRYRGVKGRPPGRRAQYGWYRGFWIMTAVPWWFRGAAFPVPTRFRRYSMKELAKQYDPSQVEDRIYQFWLDGGYFHAKADPDKKPYTIVMPPPNVTGQLHMGHAVDNTMQDILIRHKRMQGYAALWVPGTDHASIATEAKVVEAMAKEGLTKEMVGRDGFLEGAWDWKNRYGSRIVSQLKKLGSSCDWQRERFTMDEGCSDAVREVFVRLYDQGLIYRGNRMVNWCPHCNTSISDAEVEYA